MNKVDPPGSSTPGDRKLGSTLLATQAQAQARPWSLERTLNVLTSKHKKTTGRQARDPLTQRNVVHTQLCAMLRQARSPGISVFGLSIGYWSIDAVTYTYSTFRRSAAPLSKVFCPLCVGAGARNGGVFFYGV